MKKYAVLIIAIVLSMCVYAQDKKEEVAKDGWSFGALPTITFDTDLGFQYGALVNLYDYGDGSGYPNYNHSLYFEVSRFTKGSGINRFYYDSDKLFKGLQTSVDISYLSDQAYDFYGFNGYDAVVNADWFDDETSDYKTRMFYKYNRKLFRFKVDLQGKLSGDNFRWIAGVNLLNFKLESVDLEKFNDGKSQGDEDYLPEYDGLYERYHEWDIIGDEEKDGGFVPILKAGLVFDTRDNRPNPMKGVWTEAVVVTAPEFLGGESSFSKISLIHRQYFTIVPKDLSFAYRLAYQSTIAGDVPFYYQSQVITSVLKGAQSEGLGGAKSLRGIRRNSIVGDGFFYGNAELRWKFARFRWINNNFYLGLNGFVDFGQVTKKIEFDNPLSPAMSSIRYSDFFEDDAEKMHTSYGLGFRIAMNENFVISVDYGMAANEQDGNSGMYIGLNYLF